MSKPKPVFSLESLYKMCYDLKKYNKKIGLTHGAFDLFHYAHLDLLRKAASMCDFLIVGVDSDRCISEYKSYRRPIVAEEHRMEIVGELNCVDAAFVKDMPFDKESHINLYKNLLVDVITIGTKFEDKFKNLAYEEADAAGAQLIEIKVQEDPSSTSLVNKIIERYVKEGSVAISEEENSTLVPKEE
jgi:rfaE bifunctional protein nucleotidyltransferase chain/domain